MWIASASHVRQSLTAFADQLRFGIPILVIGLAALLAVTLALALTEGLTWVTAVIAANAVASIAIAVIAIVIAEGEKISADRSEDAVRSYSEMLCTHFLVSKSDTQGRFYEANDNLLRRMGYTLDELREQPMGALCSGVYSPDYLAEMWGTVNSGKTWSGEFCDRAKNGSLVWIKAIVIPWKGKSGELESITTIGVDVTEQRSAELELKRAHARLEAFVKHAPASVAMFDTEMRYVAHTERWLQDYGLEQSSLVGLNHYDVFPEVPARWRAKHARILAGAPAERSEEERFVRADGSENIIRWEVRHWSTPDGVVGGMMMLTEEISERKKLQDKLWRLAKLDSLTELPNRRLFNETLREAIASKSMNENAMGVALIDLDHFKEINDTLGHDAGDELLKIIATRLKGALGGSDVIARLGGDEFAVLVLGRQHEAEIYAALAAIEREFEDPIHLSGTLRSCSASIGVTIFPRDATEPGDLLKNADLALYRAKSLGRGRTERFSAHLRAELDRRVELQKDVLDALTRNEFVTYYQPIVPKDLAAPPSFEALLRWRHPTQGLLTPNSFEEIFEDPKVALAIGNRVADLVLRQIASWERQGLEFGRVAFNVTSADFAFGCFARRLKAKLEMFNVQPNRLCIEVTERVFLGSGAVHVSEALEQLHKLDVEIALDDFGTGYASLSHIKAYPIDRLKIDRSFVKDMQTNKDSLSIVQAIAQLGRSLDLHITAEGVENKEQALLLSSMGCGSLQGHYFAKPLTEKDVPSFLAAKRPFGSLVA
ncbi:EAL domain-containing protein [Hyphomicrobium sp. LHD-15]|uniref:bifunctional diguanylate cyclase/phosphodiesterase n=1 Tax=Hyphomicrobium sp. LHD-15 TaxID=3072142 RepID=UPI0028106427|nr:EAL domain-containing protein [Hyphomicrobium sp. LHD-15]MDQ8700187.1 EAL domain-containing protein [Hyphomicrobium sp. LHD-15]